MSLSLCLQQSHSLYYWIQSECACVCVLSTERKPTNAHRLHKHNNRNLLNKTTESFFLFLTQNKRVRLVRGENNWIQTSHMVSKNYALKEEMIEFFQSWTAWGQKNWETLINLTAQGDTPKLLNFLSLRPRWLLDFGVWVRVAKRGICVSDFLWGLKCLKWLWKPFFSNMKPLIQSF